MIQLQLQLGKARKDSWYESTCRHSLICASGSIYQCCALDCATTVTHEDADRLEILVQA